MVREYYVTLDGYLDDGVMTGYVYTRHGEIIGNWFVDENDFFDFIPEGETEPAVSDVFLGLFCQKIERWHRRAGGNTQ